MTAFQDTDYYVCMSIGNKFDIKALGEIPQNFLVKSFLPQLGITENMMELTPEVLQFKVSELLLNEKIKENCKQMSQEMQEHANLTQTAEKLENYISAKKAGI